MRQMKNNETGSILTISEHIIVRNFWEYYISTEETNDPLVKFAYVMGDYNELGYVYMPEIKDYIMTRTNDLKDIMPAEGYSWVD
jgi:hypothetical protein